MATIATTFAVDYRLSLVPQIMLISPTMLLTGVASSIREAGKANFDMLSQALLMCDRLEEVLSCSRKSKHLIIGVIEDLVLGADSSKLWDMPVKSMPLSKSRDLLQSLYKLGAHYLAASRSGITGRSSAAVHVLVLAALLELYEMILFATTDCPLARVARDVIPEGAPLWSLRPWTYHGGASLAFGDFTGDFPLTSPALLRLRQRLCRKHAAEKKDEVLSVGVDTNSYLLFGPPEGQDNPGPDDATGVGVLLLIITTFSCLSVIAVFCFNSKRS